MSSPLTVTPSLVQSTKSIKVSLMVINNFYHIIIPGIIDVAITFDSSSSGIPSHEARGQLLNNIAALSLPEFVSVEPSQLNLFLVTYIDLLAFKKLQKAVVTIKSKLVLKFLSTHPSLEPPVIWTENMSGIVLITAMGESVLRSTYHFQADMNAL
jgi:hypothetical protein